MNALKPLTIETAPDASQETLKSIKKGFGFIPNLMATFANSPAVLNGYMSLDAEWSKSSLSALEQQIILLTTSVENKCRYCIAAHSTILKSMMKVDTEVVNSIRSKTPLKDLKLNALVAFTREVVAERGHASESSKTKLINVGYSEVTMMEILVGVALKTMSNYLDHLNPTPVDTAFAGES